MPPIAVPILILPRTPDGPRTGGGTYNTDKGNYGGSSMSTQTRNTIIIVVTAVLVLALAVGGFIWRRNYKARKIMNQNETSGEKQARGGNRAKGWSAR